MLPPLGAFGAHSIPNEPCSPTDLRLNRFASCGPTQLDEFVFALCEASSIRTCPRPGAVNKRNRAGARVLLREVEAAARAQDQRQTAPAGEAASGVGKVVPALPLEPAAPNASHAPHRQAVEEMGWLDLWFHAEESGMAHARR